MGANALAGEMEEARSLLDSAERGKRQTEAELAESRNAVQEMTTINSKASAEKRTLKGAVHTMHAEIDDMLSQAKSSEEKAKKAMVDAARLADELRAEQEHASSQEKAKRALESQIVELDQRLAKLMKLLLKVDVMLWLSLSLAFVSLKLNSEVFNLRQVRATSPSKRLRDVSRNSNSNKMRTIRTKIGCLN